MGADVLKTAGMEKILEKIVLCNIVLCDII